MRQQWRIRVRGKQRKAVNVDLLVAAIMTLGEQLYIDQQVRNRATTIPADQKPNSREEKEYDKDDSRRQ